MTSDNGDGRREDGFEYQGTFYRWRMSDLGKDLMLIDRISGMPVTEFFETIEDQFDRERAPVLLAMIATSIRAEHPDWSVERIYRMVMNLSLADVVYVDADQEELPPGPPDEGGATPPPTGEPWRSPAAGSSPSSTPPASSSSPMSSATQA